MRPSPLTSDQAKSQKPKAKIPQTAGAATPSTGDLRALAGSRCYLDEFWDLRNLGTAPGNCSVAATLDPVRRPLRPGIQSDTVCVSVFLSGSDGGGYSLAGTAGNPGSFPAGKAALRKTSRENPGNWAASSPVEVGDWQLIRVDKWQKSYRISNCRNIDDTRLPVLRKFKENLIFPFASLCPSLRQ